MVSLGLMKSVKFFKRRYYWIRPSPRSIYNFYHTLCLEFLITILVKYSRAIRVSPIISLPVFSSRIVNRKEIIKYILVARNITVIGHFYSFCVSAMVLVGRLAHVSPHIPNLRIYNSWLLTKEFFHSPKTSSGYICFFSIHNYSSYIVQKSTNGALFIHKYS